MSISSLSHRLDRLTDATTPRCVPYLVNDDRELTERDRCPRCGGCHAVVIEEVVVMPDGEHLPIAEYMARRDAAPGG